ncbi:gastrokine-1-like [Dryobates pubescens]|uniref:gastrokine-1-like n=1 Tax=Dryobates pubescens TaxID=118200 RepID=UPI0023B9A3CB|nr:gastrokine-1-like [Dryobates pubescens]XP_054030891.1 gastrokine-1-like [Dryobates pubescens]
MSQWYFTYCIVTTVLLGLFLAPALGVFVGQQTGQEVFPGQDVFPGKPVFPGQDYPQNPNLNQQTTIVVGSQVLILNRQWRVAIIEKKSPQGSWKTIWNYRTGVIATKVSSERVCYISTMNRSLMPTFDALPRLAEQNRGVKGQPAQDIIYVIKRPILNLQSYGPEVVAMCTGLTTYETYEVRGPQYTVNQGSCTRLDVLHLLDLFYCRANNKV